MTKKAFDRIKSGLEEALEVAKGNAEPSSVHHFLVVGGKGKRKAIRVSEFPSGLSGAFIKEDGDAA